MINSGILLLPAVNRNLPRVVTQSPSGIVAYACRYHIYFIDARSNPPLVLDSKFIFGAHPGKIISLSFSKHKGTELLASIGDDHEIKIWDTESQTCINSAEVKECCHLSEWIYGISNTLVYPSDMKALMKWNIEKGLNGIRKIKTGSDKNVTQIVSNEKLPHLLAIGHANGTIVIMNITQENILHRLKVHSNEITSLSWSPVAPDILLSASLDLSLRMWKMGEIQPTWSYYMPTGRHRNEDKKKMRIVGICHPTNSNAIICSNLRGDVGEVVFAESEKPKFENEKPKFSYYYQGSCDLSCKSTFAFFIVSAEEGKTGLLYCFDPYKVTVWNVNKKRLTSQIPFMSQFIYDLTVSNVNPNLMAVSNGEGILKVWNSQSEATRLDLISVYVHFKTRIMTAAWHPATENIIAYGTDEGRVGIIDIVKRKVMYSFEAHHTDAVYSLSWGPCEKAPKSESGKTVFYIYSVGGGVIYIHKENDAKGKALNFDDLVERPSELDSTERNHSEMAWKLDNSGLCIGSYKGYIDIYDDKFIFLKRFNVQMKSVECLRWHPQITYMSPDGSSLKSWLACSGNDAEIYIIDSSSISEQENSTQGAIKKLIGHKKRVVSLCWSQHKDGFLVSASKDGSALVWDVLAGSIIATYLNHQDVVYAVQWSVFDQDIIYSGGQDGAVRMWKISQQTVTEVPEKAPVRKKMKKPVIATTKKLNENNSEDENANGSVAEESNIKDKKVVKVAPKESFMIENTPCKKTLFPHYSMSSIVNRDDNLNDCIKLVDILSENSAANLDSTQIFGSLKSSQCVISNEETVKYGLFADQLTAMRMIDAQGDLHKASGDQLSARYLQVMTGNIQSALEEAAETRSLTNFLVAMAPSVSHSFWQEMCEKFAMQLVSDHSYNQASFYYLACGKIYEAINVLAEKGLFVDALALAKSRLPESDPLIPKLVRGLLKKIRGSTQVGETMCYLSVNEPLVAAKTIASTIEPNHFRVAAYICRKFNLSKEADEYRILCVEKCLMKYDYSAFKLLIEQEPCMKVYSALIAVHEVLHRHIQLLKNQDCVLHTVKEMFAVPKPGEEVYFWKGSSCKFSEQSFIAYAHQQVTKDLLDTEKSSLLSMLSALEILSAKRMTFGITDAHVTIAIIITKFIILTLLEDFDAAAVIFLKIFEVSYNVVFLPKLMCSLLFPMCLSWQSDASRMVCTKVVTEEIGNINTIVESIHENMVENITSYTKQPIEIFIMPNDLQSKLRFITDRITVLLAIKKVEEYLLAYFVSSIIHDLMRLIEKKDLNLKCNAIEGKTSATHAATSKTLETESEEDILNKLIQLVIQEAEEKAKILAEQEKESVCETNPSPVDENAISENISVENSSDVVDTRITDVVVQCLSQIDNTSSSTSVAIIANSDATINGICSKEIVNNDTIGDSQTISNDGIPSEKVVAEDEYTVDNEIMNVSDAFNNESIIPDCDIIPEKVVLSSKPLICNNDIPEVDQINSENTISDFNIVPKADLSNNENIISNAASILEVDQANIENEIYNKVDLSHNENIISKTVVPEVEITNNENLISNSAIITEVDQANNENEISNKFTIPKVGLSHNENIISNTVIVPEVDMTNNENVISNSAIIAEVDQANNESGISNMFTIPKVGLSHNENIISNTVIVPEVGITNNENVISNSAIITEVDHANNESGISISDIRLISISNIINVVPPNHEKTILSSAISIENIIVPMDGNGDHYTNEHIHKQCLQDIDMFFNIISFITQSICKDEFALLYYLKERVKSLNQIRASRELSRFSKEKKTDAKVSVTKKTKDALSNLQDSSKLSENINHPQESKVEAADVKVVDPIVDPDSEICANVIDCIVDKVSNLNMQSLDDQGLKELDGPEVSTSSLIENSEPGKLNANISQEHNYASQVESGENSTVSHDSSNEICDKEVDPVNAGVVPNNLQNELEEIYGFINVLEKNSEAFHYPNPFDVIPKILRALYDVVQKSPCKFVQEKLHALIHEIISWAERFFVGDINFVCQVCQKTSVM